MLPDRDPTFTLGKLYEGRTGWRVAQAFRLRDVEDLLRAVERAAHAVEHGELGQPKQEEDQDRER
jgi:hypothetical protein